MDTNNYQTTYTDLTSAAEAMRKIIYKKVNVSLTGKVVNFYKNTKTGTSLMTLGINNGKSLSVFLTKDATEQYINNNISENFNITVNGTLNIYPIENALPIIQIYATSIIKLTNNFIKTYEENQNPKTLTSFHKLAIIGSKTSRGYKDFKDGLTYKLTDTYNNNCIEYDTPVEGDAGIKGIKEAIEQINSQDNVDLICIVRGGGDKYALSYVFDNSEVCDAVIASHIPILVGIGHNDDDYLQIEKVADTPYEFKKRKYSGTPTKLAATVNKLYNDFNPSTKGYKTNHKKEAISSNPPANYNKFLVGIIIVLILYILFK